MTETRRSRERASGFTLIELLVVMAITVILLGLIFGPLVQGFNLTNRARVQVLSQDVARRVMEVGGRDLGNGVFVFDQHWFFNPTVSDPNQQNVFDPNGNSVYIWVNQQGTRGSVQPARVLVPFAMVDLVPPARANDQNASLQPNQVDPTTQLAINRGDIALPVTPGRVIVRYWLGTRDNSSMTDNNLPYPDNKFRPRHVYTNFYDDTRNANLNDHNPMILYRAVVSPYLPNGKVDERFFHVYPQGDKYGRDGQPILYDPNFFYDNTIVPSGFPAVPNWRDDNGDGSVNISENWKAIARAMVPTDRADEVILDRDDNHQIMYASVTDLESQAAGQSVTLPLPKIAPQVRFQPTYVGNDAGAPAARGDIESEAPSAPPSTYQETNGAWTLPYRLYVFRSALDANPLQYYFADGSGNIWYQEYNTATGQLTTNTPVAGFPLTSDGHLASGARPDIMFTADPRRGLINFAFPHWITQSSGGHDPATFDPAEPNAKFDDVTKLDPDPTLYNPIRYINLAVIDPVLNPKGGSPLADTPLGSGKPFIPNVVIVPGSEAVRGPDMRPGPNYGHEITYTRVPRGTDPKSLGPNEYMINYTDLPNPAPVNNNDPAIVQQMQKDLLRMGTIIFDSQVSSAGVPNNLPTSYTDSNGNIQPAAKITVTYQIQNNLRGDIVKADYLTRQLMTFALGVRLYDFNSGQPQQITLTQKVKVRNLQR